MTIQSNIIEKYWEYDQKYEEDEIIRYISYSTECSLDYNRESKTIDIYKIFSYYEDMYEEESSNKYTKVLEIAFENFMSENTMYACDRDASATGLCSTAAQSQDTCRGSAGTAPASAAESA